MAVYFSFSSLKKMFHFILLWIFSSWEIGILLVFLPECIIFIFFMIYFLATIFSNVIHWHGFLFLCIHSLRILSRLLVLKVKVFIKWNVDIMKMWIILCQFLVCISSVPAARTPIIHFDRLLDFVSWVIGQYYFLFAVIILSVLHLKQLPLFCH